MTFDGLRPAPKPKSVRGKPRKGRAPLKKVRLKARNAKRGGHMFPKNVDEGLRDWIRGLRCILDGWGVKVWTRPGTGTTHMCWGSSQVCHIKSRGTGGPDRNNVVPMCAYAHDEQHRIGIPAFEKRWGVNLKEVAHALTAQYDVESGVGSPQKGATE